MLKPSSLQSFGQNSPNELEIILKDYGDFSNGLSHQIVTSTPQDEFYISGPFGRGVQLKNGLNLFMCAGTGILPFMDLFAYVARRVLKETNKDYAIFPDEQFGDESNAEVKVYAYYESEEQAPGLEL